MPKYKEICNEIRKRIENKVYLTNENKIPDELTLCKEFNCSRMTMKKALDLLVQEGLIYRKRGHGSFILEKTLNTKKINLLDSNLEGFTRSTNGIAKSKLLTFKLIFADKNLASFLRIDVNSPVYEILRLRFINNEPFVLEKTFMTASLITGLNENILNGSIYEYIENTLGLKISSAKKILRATKATDTDITYLNIDITDPILEVEQIAYLHNSVPFEYSISRHIYDKFEFTSFSIRN